MLRPQRPPSFRLRVRRSWPARRTSSKSFVVAQPQPDAIAFTFLGGAELTPEDRSYAQLDVQARAIGARLQRIAAPGEARY